MFHLQTRNKHGKNSHCSGIWPQVAEEGIETQKTKKKSFLKQTGKQNLHELEIRVGLGEEV